jgi:hypothetical protein
MQQQLACSQTMSCLKYLTYIERISHTPFAPHGNGTHWCTYVEDGDWSSLRLHTVSISKFSAHTELLSGGISVSGQPFLSLLIIAIPAGGITPSDEDNVVAALEHPDRVCYVRLAVTDSQLGKIATVMQEPFPVLTHLHIGSDDGSAPVLPTKFMGASAPRLQTIYLHRIPLPTLPKLLMSTNDLVKLELRRIPPTGYIPPEAMVACLAALPRLDTFHIGFKSATSRPDRIPPLPKHVPSFLHSLPSNSRVLASIWRTSSPRSTALSWTGPS